MMDAILSLAISTFEAGQTFRKAAPAYKYDALEITSFPDAMDSKDANNETTELGPKYYQRQIPEAGLLAWLREDVKSDTEHMPIMSAQPIPKASLKLLRIDRDLDVTLSIAKDCFEGIFDIMRADPSVKYMICEDYDGYHEFNGEGYLPTRFIGTGTYAIFWTFDAFTFTTRAVFIRRRLYEFFYLFSNVLRAHKSHIYNPWCLGFVSCYVTLHWSDRETSLFELKGLRHIEDKTGFGPVGKRGLKPVGMEGRFDINTLTSWSQVVNEVAGNIGNKVRHQKVSLTVLGLIAKDDGLDGIDNLPQDTLRKYRDSLDNLRRALPLLERHLATYLDFLGYLKDRSERLSAVVSLPTPCSIHGLTVSRPFADQAVPAVRPPHARRRRCQHNRGHGEQAG